VTSEAGRVFGEPPDELDETWVHGMLVGGMAAEPDQLTLARAYADAASHLIDPALASGEPWRLCYPILYLYRHALELYLKTALPPSRRPRHDLRPLLRQFETLLHDQLGVVIPDHVLDDLRTLATIDPDAQGFRYTHTREGHSEFLPGEYWVSLRDLQRFMEVVFRYLEKVLWRLPRQQSDRWSGPSARARWELGPRTLGVRGIVNSCGSLVLDDHAATS
jgi:hypothetical protein